MDDMLRVLMDMDAAARERTDEVNAMKENNQSKLAEKKSAIAEDKMKQAKLQADKFSSELSEKTEKSIEEIREKNQNAFSDMEKFARDNHGKWVAEIVARALND